MNQNQNQPRTTENGQKMPQQTHKTPENRNLEAKPEPEPEPTLEPRSGGLRARQRLRADPGERGIGRALPTSLGDDGDCAVGGDCREAGRPCIRCLSPASTCRGVFGRSLRAAANCAELCGAVPVSATIAAAPRRGSESAIALRFILTVVRELDVETSAATELACCGFAAGSHITHVQNCANLA